MGQSHEWGEADRPVWVSGGQGLALALAQACEWVWPGTVAPAIMGSTWPFMNGCVYVHSSCIGSGMWMVCQASVVG